MCFVEVPLGAAAEDSSGWEGTGGLEGSGTPQFIIIIAVAVVVVALSVRRSPANSLGILP